MNQHTIRAINDALNELDQLREQVETLRRLLGEAADGHADHSLDCLGGLNNHRCWCGFSKWQEEAVVVLG